MAFLGMRDTADFVTSANPQYTWRPENWREGILRLYPNGRAPLTAITAMMTSQPTDDPVFHWFQKDFPEVRAAITGLYNDTGLSVAYSNNVAANGTLYIKMAAADAAQFKAGHVVMLIDATEQYVAKRMNCLVTAEPTINGASSYLTLKALEADPATPSAAFDVCYAIGSAYEEGADTPGAIAYDPTPFYNYTQIFRDSLEMTRTAKKTRLRTGDQVKEARREALELHSVGIERAIMFGKRYSGTGANSRPLRTTMGLREFISTNVFNFAAETGKTSWLTSGEEWLDEKLEQLFRYGGTEKLCLCGSGALLGIQKLVKNIGTFELTKETKDYGINVLSWITSFGTLYFKTHPLLSLEPGFRNSMCVVEPKFIKTRVVDDTQYKPNRQGNGVDGEKSEWLTEIGFEYHFEKAFAWFHGIGSAPVS